MEVYRCNSCGKNVDHCLLVVTPGFVRPNLCPYCEGMENEPMWQLLEDAKEHTDTADTESVPLN